MNGQLKTLEGTNFDIHPKMSRLYAFNYTILAGWKET